MDTLISFCLILFAVKELLHSYHYLRNKQSLDFLINDGQVDVKVKPEKNKNVAFEKMMAKNSVGIEFMRRFQEQQLWKIYAMVILFSTLFFANSIFHLMELDQSTIILSLMVIIILVILVPQKIVKKQMDKKVRRVSNDLPLVVDIMAIMIKSGMTIENCFSYLSTRVDPINKDISTILERACLMMDVNGIEPAIDLIYRQVPSKEMRMLCATLKRSISYGNSIYDVLLELSAEMREMQRLDIEEKIAAVSAKMTIPMMLFILFPTLVIVAGPIGLKIMDMGGH